jgi:hypothetical protein
MIMESHGGMILTGESEELGEKPVQMPLCPPQNSVEGGFTIVYPGFLHFALVLKGLLFTQGRILYPVFAYGIIEM